MGSGYTYTDPWKVQGGIQPIQAVPNTTYSPITNQAVDASLGSSFNLGGVKDFLLGTQTPTANGGIATTPGAGGLALGAFNAYNSWNQGNKMYDLQKEAFDFSKDKFWNNFLMKRDAYNREINRRNNRMNQRRQQALNPNMTDAEQNQMIADGYTTYGDHGDAVQGLDGGTYNITNVPGQYSGQGYNQATPNSPAAVAAVSSAINQNPNYLNQVATGNIALNPQQDMINRSVSQQIASDANVANSAPQTNRTRNVNQSTRPQNVVNAAKNSAVNNRKKRQ